MARDHRRRRDVIVCEGLRVTEELGAILQTVTRLGRGGRRQLVLVLVLVLLLVLLLALGLRWRRRLPQRRRCGRLAEDRYGNAWGAQERGGCGRLGHRIDVRRQRRQRCALDVQGCHQLLNPQLHRVVDRLGGRQRRRRRWRLLHARRQPRRPGQIFEHAFGLRAVELAERHGGDLQAHVPGRRFERWKISLGG